MHWKAIEEESGSGLLQDINTTGKSEEMCRNAQ
jgi:hypothetical protein